MCFDISLLFRNKPLFVQLSTNKFGRLLTAHQHTAKDRPHAETTTHPIGSHTRNEQSRIDFLRIFYGCRLTQLDIQRTFADHAPSRSIQLDIVLRATTRAISQSWPVPSRTALDMIVSGSTCIPSRITGAQFTTTPATASLWNTTSSTE